MPKSAQKAADLKTQKIKNVNFFTDSLTIFKANFGGGGISTFIFKNGHTEFLDHDTFQYFDLAKGALSR